MPVPPRRRCDRPHASVLPLVVGLALFAAPAHAALPTASRSAGPLRAMLFDTQRRVDANRVNMFTTNLGSSAWNLGTFSPGLIWPRGSNQTAVFASGLWLGCRVFSETRIAVAEYSMEYGPGPIVAGIHDDPNRLEHIVYKVKRFTGNPQDTAHVDRTPAELQEDQLLDPLAHHAWSEYIAGAKPYGAPTRIFRFPDTSTPQPDDSVDVEGPDVQGDQMLWAVYNDGNPELHFANPGQTNPLGVEVQQTTFAFDRADDLGNIVFIKFRITNRRSDTLEDMFASVWVDPDLGDFTDDLVGCDVPRALGFCYNATNADGIYGSPPPAVGYVLLRGPLDPDTGSPRGLDAFSKYINGTDPFSHEETYNYMHGLLPDGSTLINPVTGQPTRYFNTGDPVTGQGWIDSNPADRRMLLSSGPFRLPPGTTEEIVAAVVIGRGPDRLASISTVRCLSDLARDVFAHGFAAPAPSQTCFDVPTPTLVALVSAEVVDGRVRIVWHSETAGMLATVERRTGDGEWLALASLTPDGEGLLRFEDADVVAGRRYGYRLAVPSDGQIEYLGETGIEVPSHAVLTFLGARMHSNGRDIVLSYSLATGEPARIELLDVAGRRVVARDLTGLDPGIHTLELGTGVRLPAGIYLVRLKQGPRTVTGKAAIVR